MEFLTTFFALLIGWVLAIPVFLWRIVSSRLFISGIFIVVFFGVTYLALEHIDARIYTHAYYETKHDSRETRQHFLKCEARWLLGFVLHGMYFAALGALWGWVEYVDGRWTTSESSNFDISAWLWIIPMALAFWVVHAYRDALRKDTVWTMWPTTAQ